MAKTSNFVAVAGCIAAAKAANNTGSSLGSHGGFLLDTMDEWMLSR